MRFHRHLFNVPPEIVILSVKRVMDEEWILTLPFLWMLGTAAFVVVGDSLYCLTCMF